MAKWTDDERRLMRCIGEAKSALKGRKFNFNLEPREIVHIYALFLFAGNYPCYTSQNLRNSARINRADLWVYLHLLKKEPNLVETVRSLGFTDACIRIAGLTGNVSK